MNNGEVYDRYSYTDEKGDVVPPDSEELMAQHRERFPEFHEWLMNVGYEPRIPPC